MDGGEVGALYAEDMGQREKTDPKKCEAGRRTFVAGCLGSNKVIVPVSRLLFVWRGRIWRDGATRREAPKLSRSRNEGQHWHWHWHPSCTTFALMHYVPFHCVCAKAFEACHSRKCRYSLVRHAAMRALPRRRASGEFSRSVAPPEEESQV